MRHPDWMIERILDLAAAGVTPMAIATHLMVRVSWVKRVIQRQLFAREQDRGRRVEAYLRELNHGRQ